MAHEWFIAKRFLQSNRKEGVFPFATYFSILGIALGTAALIIALSILDGFEKEIQDKVIAFVTHIRATGYQGKPIVYDSLKIARLHNNIQGITSITPFVAQEGLVRAGTSIDGVYLKGIDANTGNYDIKSYVVEGSYLSGKKTIPPEIIIGKKLANKLAVSVGSKLTLFGFPAQEETYIPKAKQFRITGIYESGMAEYDDVYALTDIQSAQDLFLLKGEVSGYEISINDIALIDTIAKQIEIELGYPHYVRTMYQLYRNLFAWIDLQKSLSPILLIIIIIVATVNVIGTLLMFVIRKVKAIGILGSFGTAPGSIRRVFFYQGLALAAIGIIAGNILAFFLGWIQLETRLISIPSDIYFMNSVPIALHLKNFFLVSGFASILAIIMTWLPSRSASKVNIVSAIRF